MRELRWLITGGHSGLGAYLQQHLGSNAQSVSRRDGFDISTPEGREKLARLSTDFDVLVNNAFDGPPHKDWADFGQARLLQEVDRLWRETNKTGYIFNIGSIASVLPVKKFQDFELYRVAKMALDEVSLNCTKAFYANECSFRCTILRFGRLDTEKSRSRANWTGNGHSLESLVTLMETCLQQPPNTCVAEINLNVNLHYSHT